MAESLETQSRKLLSRLQATLAEAGEGQERLDHITTLIADSMHAHVCSIYLFRDADTLELCATEGLNREAVHQTRLRIGEGLVGRVAGTGDPVNTADAPSTEGFRFMPETGEEVYSSFLGVPIQRLGKNLGVLVVQSKDKRQYSSDELYALEVVAMVVAEMQELGAFVGEGAALAAPHQNPAMFTGGIAQEGVAAGHVYLHEPRVVVTNLVAEDPAKERDRLNEAVDTLRVSVDQMLDAARKTDKDQTEVLEAYKMFANSRGWMRRMEEDIASGLTAEAAVEKEQSTARARMEQASDPYLRERLHDLDDLSNRLLRLLTGQGKNTGAEIPADPILVARNIGPAELLDYGRSLRGIVLEEGSVGSHAAIVARALAIPLLIHVRNITTDALNGDRVLVDGEQGIVHLRPDDTVQTAFRDKMAMKAQAQERYASIRDKPAETACGTVINLHMNAGLMADLPSLAGSGAEGVGLFRTELQFPDAVTGTPPWGTCRDLFPRDGFCSGQARGLSNARHRVGQGSSLHEGYRGTEPGPRVASDPGRARQAGRYAHAVAGADPGGEWASADGYVPLYCAARRIHQCPRPLASRDRPRGSVGPCLAGERRDRRDA